MNLRRSLEKLALNYAKLMLVEAGLPMLLDKVEETKETIKLKVRRAVNKAIIMTIAISFLFIAMAFLFIGIFFYFSNNGVNSNAAFLTGGIALLVSVVGFIIAAF